MTKCQADYASASTNILFLYIEYIINDKLNAKMYQIGRTFSCRTKKFHDLWKYFREQPSYVITSSAFRM